MTLDALLTYAHFIAIFALASTLVAELLLFRQTMAAAIFDRLRLTDRWYGIIAGLVIVTGLLRLNFGLKGAAYYGGNPIFWTSEYGRMMTLLRLEIALFVFIPLCAVFMARGFR